MAAAQRPGPAYDPVRLRTFSGAKVRVCLADGTVWAGLLRTDLMTERSLSVYITSADGGGATLYIDQIVSVDRA